MKMTEPNIISRLETIVDRISRVSGVEKIILFGSYAYGEPDEDSDIDLLVVMRTGRKPYERRLFFQELFTDRDFAMDLIVKTPKRSITEFPSEISF